MSNTVETLTDSETLALLINLRELNRNHQWRMKNTRNYAMAIFMLDAGLRVGELVQLKFSDIWLEGLPVRTLVVQPAITKNHTKREIPCTDRLQNAITELFEQIWSPHSLKREFPVFHSGLYRKALTARQVRNIISDASQRALGRRIHPHILRHTFATRLMRVTNIRIVQQLLGHKNIGSTQIYTHPNNQDLSEAISKI